MDIYSYGIENNKYKSKIEKLIKNNISSKLIFWKNNKLEKILENHPESILSEYELILFNRKFSLTLLQACAYYSKEKIINNLLSNKYFEKKEKILVERFFNKESEEEEEYIDNDNYEEILPYDIKEHLYITQKNELQKALYYALIGGNKKNFLLLLKKGGLINESISNEWIPENKSETPLSVAISLEDFKLADEIIKLGGSINNIGYSLHEAIKKLNIKKVKYIVEKGGDINLRNNFGLPPLYYLVFSNKIYKEKINKKVYKIIDILESGKNKIYWGEKNITNEKNNKYNLLNSLIASGYIKNQLIEYCIKKGGFLDSNNVHIKSRTVEMVKSLYKSNILKNIEKYGIDIEKTDLIFNFMKNSFEGIKKYPSKEILLLLNETNKNINLNKIYEVDSYEYPINILFFTILLKDFESFKYLIELENRKSYIPKKKNFCPKNEYDYFLYLLLIGSYNYKKKHIDNNEDILKILKYLINKGADPMLNVSMSVDFYPLILRFLSPESNKQNNKDKLRDNIFSILISSKLTDKEKLLNFSIIYFFKLLKRCDFEEKQLINNSSLHKNNIKKKKKSLDIVNMLFVINNINSEIEKDIYYKKVLLILMNEDLEIYKFIISTEFVENIFNREKKLLYINSKEEKVIKKKRI